MGKEENGKAVPWHQPISPGPMAGMVLEHWDGLLGGVARDPFAPWARWT